ncbi:hypothetical protein BBO99_00006300 [Phytophthora kernoviae]|uniref:Carbohydrate-binding protein n=2 Tax=Phytophthora kernoviae TaxID=325452 RepID=A0A3R7JAJ5_9STRA|nr:hypothetical protein G195_009940 [Phytophthora kernoviae 00238/432]KAG2511672.1 hypothetical protein JM16_006160 [Phytophthora kernoviae]KAG2513499.1 hypothetical protein JM18_008326 [Phytophthora kernoviae]RLN27030.1 hypothetical protein BBI17_006447 [Phytophthora kernoviae]RLN77996.1 hypothetical protein BBO99_00006300 [Phytophthora kernoviae]
MHSSWLLVAIMAVASAANNVNASTASQCTALTTCYEGGASATPCTIANGGCPPCVTFADKGCYVKVNDQCPFGVDCNSYWSGSGSSGSTTTTSSGSTTGSTTSSKTTTESSTAGTSTTTSSKSASDTSGTAGVSSNSTSSTSGSSEMTAGDSSDSGSDMSVVFAIIGAAIGVIAVAVIFLTLVRRSKAASEDEDDDMANTPPAFAKNVQAPSSTTGAAMYASYGPGNRAPGMGSGAGAEIGLDISKGPGVSMNAVSYYNQQPPQNSAAPSPRVAGRAIPSQPVGMNQAQMARPFGSNQNFNSSGVGVTQAPPTPVQQQQQHHPMGGVAPSPHIRRESYEF